MTTKQPILSDIVNLIDRMQHAIGNNAEITFSMDMNNLVIRCNWWTVDFHAIKEFGIGELEYIVVPHDVIIDYTCQWFTKQLETLTKDKTK